MSDNLKNFIQEHREEWEQPFASEKSWKKIASKIEPRKKRFNLLVAASVSVVIIVAFYVGKSQNDTQLLTEWQETELYYQAQISQMVTQVKLISGDDEILTDLEKMDAVFYDVRRDLGDNVDNEEVVSAMMEHYRMKVKILERILEELEDDDTEKHKNL